MPGAWGTPNKGNADGAEVIFDHSGRVGALALHRNPRREGLMPQLYVRWGVKKRPATVVNTLPIVMFVEARKPSSEIWIHLCGTSYLRVELFIYWPLIIGHNKTQQIILNTSIWMIVSLKQMMKMIKNGKNSLIFSKIKIWIGSMLPYLLTLQTQQINLRASIWKKGSFKQSDDNDKTKW